MLALSHADGFHSSTDNSLFPGCAFSVSIEMGLKVCLLPKNSKAFHHLGLHVFVLAFAYPGILAGGALSPKQTNCISTHIQLCITITFNCTLNNVVEHLQDDVDVIGNYYENKPEYAL